MKMDGVGILVGLRPFNERDMIARIFSREYGVMVGMLRGAVVAKKNKPLLGQVGEFTWSARLDAQLGVFHWGAEKNLVAEFMTQPQKLMLFNSVVALIDALLPEREAYTQLYDETLKLLSDLNLDSYLNWEIALLRELGYALDLSHCSGCGGVDELCYLSPRTGRAVCRQCAAPYINKLYKLPINLNTTYRFLESVCGQQGINMPLMRNMLKLV